MSLKQCLIALIVCFVTASQGSFYNEEAEGPPYTVIGGMLCPQVKKYIVQYICVPEGPGGYEIREYPDTNWISSDGQATTIHDGKESKESFWKLFRYIRGENMDGITMPMATPVTMAIHPGRSFGDKANYTVSFYLGGTYQTNPPVPTETGIYIEARPPMKVI